jgi:hypothetical protein
MESLVFFGSYTIREKDGRLEFVATMPRGRNASCDLGINNFPDGQRNLENQLDRGSFCWHEVRREFD